MQLISTGISELDDCLDGIFPCTIIDIFGAGGSGKTQLVMQICLNSLQHGNILYQDTTGSFRPERILQLIKFNNLHESLLDRIIVSRMTNTAEQVGYTKQIFDLKPSLIVIENITDLFDFEYDKNDSLSKHVKFMEYMHMLNMISIQTRTPIVVTNTIRNSDNQEFENLNKSISMFTHKKIKLTKHGSKFSAQVLPTFGKKREIYYKITNTGLVATS